MKLPGILNSWNKKCKPLNSRIRVLFLKKNYDHANVINVQTQ